MCIRDRKGDERVSGRIRSEGRQLSAVPVEAVSTPPPEATSFDHGSYFMRGRMSCCRCWPINGAYTHSECSCRGTDLVSWGTEISSVQGRGV